ncbi:ADP-ribosylglycohydrolase family protein [Sphingomonas sp.]|uniref:ADP-ribosylglycohydrolase family protein n=1 Tax=Sphingomonas sp. TaxID=28214 RepID=UPI003CC59BCC
MSAALLDRIHGCLIGGAIGDAMGAPGEDWHYADIRAAFGHIDRFLPQPARKRDGAPGQITDDTTLRHYMCLAIIRKRGRITPDDYAAVWLSDLNPDRLFVTERIVLEKLRLGMNPWETGRGQPAADAAIMAVAPMGIVNAGDPAQAYQDAVAISSIHQDGLERDAAGVVAAGVAAALVPGATTDGVLAAMTAHGSFDTKRLLRIAADLAAATGDVDAFTEQFYLRHLDRSFPRPADVSWDQDRTVSPTSREVLPIVAGLFALCDGDPRQCIVAGASFGRDADTIATVLGGLSGALRGAGVIPADWVADSEAANRGFFEEVGDAGPPDFHATAVALYDVLHAEQRRIAARAEALGALLAA